jgi:hypothetical protein
MRERDLQILASEQLSVVAAPEPNFRIEEAVIVSGTSVTETPIPEVGAVSLTEVPTYNVGTNSLDSDPAIIELWVRKGSEKERSRERAKIGTKRKEIQKDYNIPPGTRVEEKNGRPCVKQKGKWRPLD